MNTPLVSILIPNYNKDKYIRETLDSVIAQTYINWECIIVDDHSTDNSWEIIEEYAAKDSRFKIHKRPAHLLKGGNVCRNYAFELSKGAYIQWFDSDDLMSFSLLENRIYFMQKYQSDFIIIGGKYFKYKVGDLGGFLPPLSTYPNITESFIIANPPWTTLSCLFRKKFLIDKNLFWNENLLGLQDVEFNLNTFSKSDRIVISYEFCDHYWRLFEDNSSTGGNHFTFKKFETLFEFIYSLTIILDHKLYYQSIRNSSFEFLFNSKKKISFKWFSQLVVPIYRLGLIKNVELIKILIVILSYYINKRNASKKLNIVFKMGQLLLTLEPNLKNSHRVAMPVNEKEFDDRMRKLKITPNQKITCEGKEFIILN